MAILLGTQGGDILAWRGVAELVAEIRGITAERMTCQLSDENLDFLEAIQGRLEEEIGFEERFAAEFRRAEESLEHAAYEDDFIPLLPRFNQLAQVYFQERGSVVAVHTLCNAYRDGLVRKALQLTEDALATDEKRKPPAPYCLLAAGSTGRREQTLCVDSFHQFIHEDDENGGTGYFKEFARRAALLLGKAGLLRDVDSGAKVTPFWRCGRKEWRDNNFEVFKNMDQQGVALLLKRADFRLVHGDASLADEMLTVVRSTLDFNQQLIRSPATAPVVREVGKRIAETPAGLDFFGRFKVEKGRRHRGRFDLGKYAIAPLVANIRLMAVDAGLVETSTIGRIKGLQEGGHLSVELTERLLRAYHDFTRLKILRQIKEVCETERTCFIDPQELSEDEDQRLRTGMEAVTDLEKIAYLCFTEHG